MTHAIIKSYRALETIEERVVKLAKVATRYGPGAVEAMSMKQKATLLKDEDPLLRDKLLIRIVEV